MAKKTTRILELPTRKLTPREKKFVALTEKLLNELDEIERVALRDIGEAKAKAKAKGTPKPPRRKPSKAA